MNYYLNLFTPETWISFYKHGADVSGFRERHRTLAYDRCHVGDVFLCYLVRLSRWCGALEIVSGAYEDRTEIFSKPDPFIIRCRVRPIVVLDPEHSIPIFEDEIWSSLSETKGIEKGAHGWAKYYRGSLRKISQHDGDVLLAALKKQAGANRPYPFSERDKRQLSRKLVVRSVDREVSVEVPEEDEELQDSGTVTMDQEATTDTRESIRIQAKVAGIGAKMGFRVWVPRNDRARVLECLPTSVHSSFLDSLPLNYDDTTLRTIEQIDVLWLKGRAMARAFEIEHTTAVYSGLLRMADLLALQPNMDIRLHIVAPDEKRDKVLKEIKRPVFSLLDRGPLYERCTFVT